MSKILKYEELVGVENKFLKPTLEKVNSALKMVFEGKVTKLVGSDFDKNIVFFVDKDLKTAKFNISEGKIKIYSIEDISVDSESFGEKFQSLMSEAIDLLAADKDEAAKSIFNEAINILARDLSGDKTTIFNKRPVIKESKIAIKKVIKYNNVDALRILASKAMNLKESYYGKDIIAESYYEISEGKAIKIENLQKEPSTLCKVISAKREALKLDVSPMLENVEKFISEHEEVFFLSSEKIRTALNEAAKKDVSATKEKVNETILTFKKKRNESVNFRKIVAAIMNEQEVPQSELGQGEQAPVTKAGLEADLDDKVVSDLDRKTEEEKLGFMTQFVDILEKLFQKIKEVGQDDEDIQRRADFALDTIAKAKEEGKWDKDELSEIAREAIEVAAKLEGIEPEETAVSKAAEEAGEEDNKNIETIDNPQPESGDVDIDAAGGEASEVPGEEGVEEVGGEEFDTESGEEEVEDNALNAIKKREDDTLDETEDISISSEGEVTYDDVSDEQADDEEQLDEIKCFTCDEKFAVKKGRGSYKCPYCSEEVNDELMPPVAEEDDVELDETGVPINNIHPQELDEAHKAVPFTKKAVPQPSVNKGHIEEVVDCSLIDDSDGTEIGDIAVALDKLGIPEFDAHNLEMFKDILTNLEPNDIESLKSALGDGNTESIKNIILKDTNPDLPGAVGEPNPTPGEEEEVELADDSQEAYKAKWQEMQGEEAETMSEAKDGPESAGGEPITTSGKAMSKNPAIGKAEVIDGTKLPDSGNKMSKSPAKGKMKRLDGNPLSNKGGKDSTWPKVGKIEVVDGTELPDSGNAMKANPSKGKIKGADSSTGLPNTGSKMSSEPATGKMETLKESEGPESAGGASIVKEQNAPISEVPIQEKEISSAPSKNADILATYKSASNPDKRYYIVRGKDEVVYCTCPAWKFSGKGGALRTCKHLQDFKDEGSGVVKEMIEGIEESFIREEYQGEEVNLQDVNIQDEKIETKVQPNIAPIGKRKKIK